MQHQPLSDIQQYAKRRRRNKRNRLLSCIASVLVFCITYAALLPAIAQAAPYISESIQTLFTPPSISDSSDNNTSYAYSNHDIDVNVQLPADSRVPKDAVLRVTPIKEKTTEYAVLASKAENAIDGTMERIQFYDISFYTKQMDYIPVDDRAKVSITYNSSTMDADSKIVVLHYDENDDNPIALNKVSFSEEPHTSEQELTFETDGFSIFAVVQVSSRAVTDYTNLENRSFIIAGVNFTAGNYTLPVLTSTVTGNHLSYRATENVTIDENRVTSITLGDYTGAIWTFERAGTDSYYIKNVQGQYLSIPGNDALTLSNNPQEFRFTPASGISSNNGDIMNAVCIQTIVEGTTYNLNIVNNQPNRDFSSWSSGTDDKGNHMVLLEYTDTIDTQPLSVLSNLAGKNYIIAGINLNGGNFTNGNPKALPILTSDVGAYWLNNADNPGANVPVLNGNSRTTADVAYDANNNVTTITLEDTANAIWAFEKADLYDNAYYIKNLSTNTYLHIDNQSITLNAEPQAIVALKADGFATGDSQNAIYLRTADMPYYYVNLIGNGNTPYFFGYNRADRGGHLVLVEYNKPIESPSNSDPTSFDGKSYIIAGVNFTYGNFIGDIPRMLPVLTSEADPNNQNHLLQRQTDDVVYTNGQVTAVTLANDTGAIWTFKETNNGTYYIQNAQGKYLSINQLAVVTLSDTPHEFSVEAATNLTNDDATNAVCLHAVGTDYYINLVGNESNKDFTSWTGGTGERGNHLVLIELPEQEKPSEYDTIITQAVTPNERNNLAGMTIVITNPNEKRALTSVYAQKNNTIDLLQATDDVLPIEVIGDTCTSVTIPADNDTLLWIFEGTDTPGYYYIKSVATGQYLHIQETVLDGDRPLTLSDTPQAIEVYFSGAGNEVNLRYHVTDDVLYSVDYYGSVGEYGPSFGVWTPGYNSELVLTKYPSVVDPSAAVVDGLGGKKFIISAVNNEIWGQDNGVWTPKVLNSTHEIGGGAGEEGVLGDLAESFEIVDNQLVSVTVSSQKQNSIWEFEAVPNKAGTYYIKNSGTGTYLNLNPGNQLLLSETKQEIRVITATGFEDGDVQNAVCLVSNGIYMDLWDNFQHCTISAIPSNSAHRDTHFALTEVKEEEENRVTNLDGETLAIISIHDLNPAGTTAKYALTPDVDTKNNNALQGVNVELLNGSNGKIYHFNDSDFPNDDEFWTFEAVEGLSGVYYIKNGAGYLNIGDGTASVSGTPQEITVLTETIQGEDGFQYDVVYFRVVVNGEYCYLSRENVGDTTAHFGRIEDGDFFAPAKRFLLATEDTPQLSFEITVDNMEGAHEWLYQPTFEDGTTTTKTYNISDLNSALPTSAELGAEPVNQAGNLVQHFVSYPLTFMMDMTSDFRQAFGGAWGDNPVTNEAIKNAIYDPTHFTDASPYWGAEYELTHWEVVLADGSTLTDDDGNAVKFAPGTQYTLTDEGMIELVAMDGKTYELYPNITTFKAKYVLFSDILTFYLNHTGKIADIDGNIKSLGTGNYTLSVAAGHVYYPKQFAGQTEEDYNEVVADIAALFKETHDPDLKELHIVLDGFISRDTAQDKNNNSQTNPNFSDFDDAGKGVGAALLQEHVFDYVRRVSDVDITLRAYTGANGENTPTLNASTIDSSTFDIKWYVLKNEGDSWHIDGVVVGETLPIVITKTFHGLDMNLIQQSVVYNGSSNFRVLASIYKNETDANEFYYIDPTNTTDAAQDGHYIYNGGNNPYNWTMSAMLGQVYNLEEQNYTFDGYDCVSTVTVTDVKGNSTTSDSIFATVTGGEIASVTYNNYYTPIQTGMFIIRKTDSSSGLLLAGAEFTLFDAQNNALRTATTDANGEVFFDDLREGVYTLKETQAPNGYINTNTTWTIKVGNNGVVTAVLHDNTEKILYTDSNETMEPLEITNTPEKDTITVVKQFVGITPEQIDRLVNNYQIVLQSENGSTTKTLRLAETQNNGIGLTISNDRLTYTWTLTQVPDGLYTVTESNYELKNWVASVNVIGLTDGNYTTQVDGLTVQKNQATFQTAFAAEHADSFIIQNSYTNDFSIQITKVDSQNNNTPLANATFDVYGDLYIATDYSTSITINGKTLYLLGTVTTDSNGIAIFDGWNFQDVAHNLELGLPYAIVETKAPDGYQPISQPIYLGTITSDGIEDLEIQPNISFNNGIYSIAIGNAPLHELPETGGTGITPYTLGGLLFVLAPLLYLGYKRKFNCDGRAR